MKKNHVILVVLLVVAALAVVGYSKNNNKAAADRADDNITWQYKTADEVMKTIETKADAIYFDIRQPENYAKGHLPNSVVAHAYPVETPEQEAAVMDIKNNMVINDAPIIVVCEGGGKGAKRAISLLVEGGIGANRFFILEGGARKWPYSEVLVGSE